MDSVSERIAEILKRKSAGRKPNPAPVGRKMISEKQVRMELGLDVSNQSIDSSEESSDEDITQSINGSKDRLQLIKDRRKLTRKIGLSMGGDFNQFTMPVPAFNPKIQFESFTSEPDHSETRKSFDSRANHTPVASVSSVEMFTPMRPLRNGQNTAARELLTPTEIVADRSPLHTEFQRTPVHRFGSFMSAQDLSDTGENIDTPLPHRTFVSSVSPVRMSTPLRPSRNGQNIKAKELLTPMEIEPDRSSLRSGFRPPAVHRFEGFISAQDHSDTGDTIDVPPIYTSVASVSSVGVSTPLRPPRNGQNITAKELLTPMEIESDRSPLRSGFRPPAVHSFEGFMSAEGHSDIGETFDVQHRTSLSSVSSVEMATPLITPRNGQDLSAVEIATPTEAAGNNSPFRRDFRPQSVHRFGRRVVDDSVFSAVVQTPVERRAKRKANVITYTDSESSIVEDNKGGVKEMVLKPKKLIVPVTPPVGLRRSQRVKLPPLRHWTGEEPLYAQTPNGGRRLIGTTRVVVRDPRLVKAKTTDFLKLIQREHKRK